MVQFKSWEQYDETHNESRRLILVGDALTRHYFIKHNKLNPAFELDYEEMCESLSSLVEEKIDILVSYITPFDICRVILKLEQHKIKDGSFAYIYHKFDIKTGSFCDCDRKVFLNGSLVYNGDYNFYRRGLNIEMLSEDDFVLLKTAFKDASLTKNELSTIKSDNCNVTIKEGRAIRINSIDDLSIKRDNNDNTKYVYLLGGCVWSSNYSTHFNKIKQILQRNLDTKNSGKYVVEHISNVGCNEKVLLSLKNAKLHTGGVVFIGNITKPEIILAACRICEAQKCKAIVYLFPNILARRCPSEYERRIIDQGWGTDVSELQEQLASHSALMDELGFLGIDAYEPPTSFFESENTLLLDFSGVHLGDWANEIIAKHMTDIIVDDEKIPTRFGKTIEITESLISDIIPGINFYLARLDSIRKENNYVNSGAIVMACNPFTNGHKYLIEYASSRVEHLYVLVVQEDCLDFTFEERLSLVRKNTTYLKNVTVIPGGEFVISNITFGDYFSRAARKDEDSRPDATLDLLIFASVIAPSLNVNTRFVGSEPLCSVTRSYNEQMKSLLPKYGCNVVEVPRLTLDGKIISASFVRKLISERKFSAIRPLVPQPTFDCIKMKYHLYNEDTL